MESGSVSLSRAFDAGCFAHRARQASVPQDAAHGEPNQVRCMHIGWDDLDKLAFLTQMKNP